jgi:hypothetical protein
MAWTQIHLPAGASLQCADREALEILFLVLEGLVQLDFASSRHCVMA